MPGRPRMKAQRVEKLVGLQQYIHDQLFALMPLQYSEFGEDSHDGRMWRLATDAVSIATPDDFVLRKMRVIPYADTEDYHRRHTEHGLRNRGTLRFHII